MVYICKRLFLLLIVLFLFRDIYSQRYFTTSYDIENGLPTRMVYDICQDTSGLIWLATYEGISCYDGFKFLNYNGKDSLPDQKFKLIKCDEKGILWCVPKLIYDTIVCYENNIWKRLIPFERKDKSIEINSFDVMYVDNKPVLCAGSGNGVYLLKDNIWKQYDVAEAADKNIVTRVIANKGKFYLSTLAGLCVFENEKYDWSLNDKLSGFKLLTIEFENKGKPDEKLWALSNKSIGYFEDGNFKIYLNDLKLPDYSFVDNAFLKFHVRGKIFIGNSWGKYYIERATDRVFPLMNLNGFSSNGAVSMFIDKEDNVWFVDTRGVDKFSKLALVNYFEYHGLLENEVTAIAEFNDGGFLLGHNDGLTIMNSDNNCTRLPFKSENIHSCRVLDMFKDNEGNVWFSANELGTGKVNSNGNIKWYKNKESVLSSCVAQDIEGRIWIGTRNYLYFLKNDKFTEYKHVNKVFNTYRKIFPSDKGGIYVAGIHGLWYLDDNDARKIPSPEGDKAENVYSYYKNKSGVEFVGTANGLFVIENGQIVKYNKNGVNIKSPVYFIFQDKDDYYWLGSNDGVLKWDGVSNVEIFNTRNGLAGHETNRAAGLLDSHGRVWIGTDLGLSCFKPEFSRVKIPVPKIMLYDLEDSKGNQYYLDESVTIPYSENTLIFNFRGISFANEDMIVYKYKLEGYDKDWQEIRQSMLDKVKYVDVDPGKYRFSVMAKNFSGEWSEVKNSGFITINSPFYKSVWFYILILLLFGGMVGSFVKIKDQKYQNAKLEKEIRNRKRIEQDLIDSKRKYQDIVELLPEAIYETNNDGNLIYANSHCLKLFNITYDDLKKGIKIKDIISLEEHSESEENMDNVFYNQSVYRTEYVFISKSGYERTLSINADPIFKNGKTVGLRSVAIDMTEHKKVQKTLMKYADDLKVLNASKDKFFSIVAHDLKNPFQGLLGFSDFLHSDYDSLTEDEKKEYIGYIKTTSRNAYNLLDNLLQWSRLQTGRIEVVPVRLNLFGVTNSVVELLTSNAVRKRITIVNNVDKKTFVRFDSNMLNSILQNLISNAIKFTNKNGEVRIEAEHSDDMITIRIIDNGVGMNEDELSKLFKIDQHVSNVGTMNETGTGLGLLLCKEMVELNGGTISVLSESGKGSEFRFTIHSA